MANAPIDSPQPDPQQSPPTRQWSAHPMDPRPCVVLLPFPTHIARQCQFALEELQRRGYDVWRVGAYAAVDQGRNQMATDALAAGYEETFWIGGIRLTKVRCPMTGVCLKVFGPKAQPFR